ncbi:hypothetical protein BGZ98_004950 [Dissophora globulifera]|nr:hypothetical protein BGZ98_004950 [Dissophora globulifera]
MMESFKSGSQHGHDHNVPAPPSLGDFDSLLSFLHRQKSSPPAAEPTSTSNAGSQDKDSHMAVKDGKPLNGHSRDPSTAAGALGDLTSVLQFLQANKIKSASLQRDKFSATVPRADSDVASLPDAFSSRSHCSSSMVIEIPPSHPYDKQRVSISPELSSPLSVDHTFRESQHSPLDEDDGGGWSSSTVRQSIKGKHAARKALPIDEPCSSGGWASSESDHKEDVPLTVYPKLTAFAEFAEFYFEGFDCNPTSSTSGTVLTSKTSTKTADVEPAGASRITQVKKKWPRQQMKILHDLKAVFKLELLHLKLDRQESARDAAEVDKGAQGRARGWNDEHLDERKVITNKPRLHLDATICTHDSEDTEHAAISPTTLTQSLSEDQMAAKNRLAMRKREVSTTSQQGLSLLERVLESMSSGQLGRPLDRPDASISGQGEIDLDVTPEFEEAKADIKSKALPQPETTTATAYNDVEPTEEEVAPSDRLYIFIDNSNILNGFYQFRQQNAAVGNAEADTLEVRATNKSKNPIFDYGTFFKLLRRNRYAAQRVLVGSFPFSQKLDVAVEDGYEVHILRRVQRLTREELGAVPPPGKQPRYPSSGSNDSVKQDTHGSQSSYSAPVWAEQGVDEILHLKILEAVFDHEPATLVVATGDGGDSEFGGGGFPAVIRRALKRGWQVEIVSWEEQLSGAYLELVQEYGYKCDDHEFRRHSFPAAPLKEMSKKQDEAAKLHKRNSGDYGNGKCKNGHLKVWILDWCSELFVDK